MPDPGCRRVPGKKYCLEPAMAVSYLHHGFVWPPNGPKTTKTVFLVKSSQIAPKTSKTIKPCKPLQMSPRKHEAMTIKSFSRNAYTILGLPDAYCLACCLLPVAFRQNLLLIACCLGPAPIAHGLLPILACTGQPLCRPPAPLSLSAGGPLVIYL